MTEAEWLTGDDPTVLLNSISASRERKLRLFGCACCRRAWHLYDAIGRNVVEVAERIADSLATSSERRVANASVRNRDGGELFGYGPKAVIGRSAMVAGVNGAHHTALNQTEHLTGSRPHADLGFAAYQQHLDEVNRILALEQSANAVILRDIFGNPFRPVAFSSEWRTDTAIALARQMYEAREFGAMPILADALQDAGCDNEHILSHCRDANATHVRGCWVVDLVLGME